MARAQTKHTSGETQLPAKRKSARLTALLLYLASRKTPASAEEIREMVGGYDPDESEEAFRKKFLRDRATLAACGIIVEESEKPGLPGNDSVQLYSIDPAQLVASELPLTPRQAALLRTAATNALANPSFPLAQDLRRALNKLTDALGFVLSEDTEGMDRDLVSTFTCLRSACNERRRVSFVYPSSKGGDKDRIVCPYSLFLFQGDWYLKALDEEDGVCKDFRIARIREASLADPHGPGDEFKTPESLDENPLKLIFQCGSEEPFTARVLFSPANAWKADSCTLGKGKLTDYPDGSVLWEVEANDRPNTARWIVENAPGVTLIGPADVVELLHEGLMALAASSDVMREATTDDGEPLNEESAGKGGDHGA